MEAPEIVTGHGCHLSSLQLKSGWVVFVRRGPGMFVGWGWESWRREGEEEVCEEDCERWVVLYGAGAGDEVCLLL